MSALFFRINALPWSDPDVPDGAQRILGNAEVSLADVFGDLFQELRRRRR